MTNEEAIKELQSMCDHLHAHGICDKDSKMLTACKMAISALEQQPCEDAVSRNDAEQMFRNIRCHLKPQDYKSAEEFNTRDLMLLNAEQMIHALPSVMHKSGKWIPVSERLPEYNGWYQCTANLDDLLLTVDLYYKNGKWLDNRRINMFDTYEIYGYGNSTEKHKLSYEELISEFDWTANVIAWMPQPESYEPQESEVEE